MAQPMQQQYENRCGEIMLESTGDTSPPTSSGEKPTLHILTLDDIRSHLPGEYHPGDVQGVMRQLRDLYGPLAIHLGEHQLVSGQVPLGISLLAYSDEV